VEPTIRKVPGYIEKHIYKKQPTDCSEGYHFDVIRNTQIHNYLFDQYPDR